MARIPDEVRWRLEELSREIDMLVFKLEQEPQIDPKVERSRHRRELERIRDELVDLTRP